MTWSKWQFVLWCMGLAGIGFLGFCVCAIIGVCCIYQLVIFIKRQCKVYKHDK